ncbi:alpha/beta hydrolase fold domain-containing protein [Aeromicrobium terrae]|nr:alpha/beta hydrolase [Aeromicrobium terrae]
MRWTVNERRASWPARVYVLGMRANRDKDAFEGEENTLRIARKRQRSGNRPPTWWTRTRMEVREETVDGMTVWRVRPRDEEPIVTVVYLHGGGYVHPLTTDYWRLVRALASTPAEVVVPAYPLAPDATVDDVVPRLTDLAAHEAGQGPTVLMGDSAGGALALVLAQQLRDAGRPQARAVVALCPWLDATLHEDAVADLESKDPMLAESGLRAAGRWWAGDRDPSDPMVSPLEGRLDDLPPLTVMIGDRDILRPAVDELAERAGDSGVELQVREVPSMFHVWMTHPIPEAQRTRRWLVRFLRGVVGRR